jgi:GH15 family glucan-1,4-alpha-glucosidase
MTLLIPQLGLRLADKRSLPCPRRNRWLEARDELYEQIMQKAWNPEKKFFAQSYDEIDVLDSAVLIMPLVFFSTAVGQPQAMEGHELICISKV